MSDEDSINDDELDDSPVDGEEELDEADESGESEDASYSAASSSGSSKAAKRQLRLKRWKISVLLPVKKQGTN